jgi:hypothetical protein
MKKYQEGENSDLERSYNGRHNIDMATFSACCFPFGIHQAELTRAGISGCLCLPSGPKEVYLNLEIEI